MEGKSRSFPSRHFEAKGKLRAGPSLRMTEKVRITDKVRMNPGPAAAESSMCRAPSHGASDLLPSRPGPAGAQGRPSGNVTRLVSAYPVPAAAGSSVCRAPSHGASEPLPSQPDPAEAGVVRAAMLPSWCLPIPAPRPPGCPCVGRHLMAPPTPCRASPIPRRWGSSERQCYPPGLCLSRLRGRRVVRV